MTESLHKLQYAEMVINSLYVDSVDEVKLVEDGIRGMLSKLDPHSSYATPKEVKELKEPLDGNFEGIGVQFNMMEDTLHRRCEDVERGDHEAPPRSKGNEGGTRCG